MFNPLYRFNKITTGTFNNVLVIQDLYLLITSFYDIKFSKSSRLILDFLSILIVAIDSCDPDPIG